jgi:aryl-alcohol dehydrogenase-like predicted oxidoreductase
MDYRPLGRTGVQVSELCLGTMMFGAWGDTDHDDSIRIIHAALDAGINFVDTADVYSTGESEEIVGKALQGRRDDVVLATEVSVPMDDDRTTAATRAGGSSGRSRARSAGSGPTGSTSTRSTARTRRPTPTRRSAR